MELPVDNSFRSLFAQQTRQAKIHPTPLSRFCLQSDTKCTFLDTDCRAMVSCAITELRNSWSRGTAAHACWVHGILLAPVTVIHFAARSNISTVIPVRYFAAGSSVTAVILSLMTIFKSLMGQIIRWGHLFSTAPGRRSDICHYLANRCK